MPRVTRITGTKHQVAQDWLRAARGQITIPFCPQFPTERQGAFLALKCREALFGGAAGPGKSSALLMAALQYVNVPGYAAILFRRTYADLALPGALMDRMNEWLQGTRAHWNDKEKTWTFPSGATLTFAYLENPNDHYRYQGAEFQFCGFDELTQHLQHQYLYLFSRLRRLKGVEIPIRMRTASNPGGVGHDWVRQRFIEEGEEFGRVFVPAKLEDNPHLDREEYEKSLQLLDPITRAQLLAGDWDVRPEGRMFKRDWFEIVDELPRHCRWVRYYDHASTKEEPGKDPDYTAGALIGISMQGVYYVGDMRRLRDTPAEVERVTQATAQADGLGVSIRIEQEPGSSGAALVSHYIRNVVPGYVCRGHRSTGNKETRATVLSSQAEAGNVKLLRGSWNNTFLDEVVSFPTKGIHDDQVDAVSGAMDVLTNLGVAVYVEFAESHHVAVAPITFDPARWLYCAFTCREGFACIPTQLNAYGQWLIFPPIPEVEDQALGMDGFAEMVATHLAREYALPEGLGLEELKLTFCGDPEGAAQSARPGEAPKEVRSRFDILRRHLNRVAGVPGVQWSILPGAANLTDRLKAVRERLTTTLAGGAPAFLVDPRAHSVIEALSGEYRYPRGADARLEAVPQENYSARIADALGFVATRAFAHTKPRNEEDTPAREWVSRAASRTARREATY